MVTASDSSLMIYLDFDGVLHPTGGTTLPFEYMPTFEAVLRQYPKVQVVITSSWREVFSLEYIRDTFFSEGVGDRVIGCTPILRNSSRYDEIMMHRDQHGYLGTYLVIDDDASQFPEGWPPLLLCDGKRGLDTTMLETLKRQIKILI